MYDSGYLMAQNKQFVILQWIGPISLLLFLNKNPNFLLHTFLRLIFTENLAYEKMLASHEDFSTTIRSFFPSLPCYQYMYKNKIQFYLTWWKIHFFWKQSDQKITSQICAHTLKKCRSPINEKRWQVFRKYTVQMYIIQVITCCLCMLYFFILLKTIANRGGNTNQNNIEAVLSHPLKYQIFPQSSTNICALYHKNDC